MIFKAFSLLFLYFFTNLKKRIHFMTSFLPNYKEKIQNLHNFISKKRKAEFTKKHT